MNTISNIDLNNETWVEIYGSTGIEAGSPVSIQVVLGSEVIFCIADSEPELNPDGFGVIDYVSKSEFIFGDEKIWCRARTTEAKINVSQIGEAEIMNFGATLEASFTDMTLQSGAVSDSPKTIRFGAGGISPNSIISVDSVGVITVLKTGPLLFKTRYKTGRTGSTGQSRLFFWVEISVDGGSNWSVTGNSIDITLDSANESQVFLDFTPLNLVAGVKLRSRFSRSSTGNDSGDLISSSPSAALATYGVPGVPSAQISVYRFLDQEYI